MKIIARNLKGKEVWWVMVEHDEFHDENATVVKPEEGTDFYRVECTICEAEDD